MGLNPLAWRGVSGGVGTIKELDTSELRELAYAVLKQVATSNGCGSMFLSTNTTFQLVGTHEDIFRDSTNPNIVSSTVHEIRQNVNAASISETLPPAFIRTANSEYPLVQANDSLIQTLANNILYYCTFEEDLTLIEYLKQIQIQPTGGRGPRLGQCQIKTFLPIWLPQACGLEQMMEDLHLKDL